MEKFKELDELTKIDSRHIAMGKVCGYIPNLEKTYQLLREETLNPEVPEDIQSQFNVARNMAMYSYFLYSLAPEVQHKTYTIIEFALRTKFEKVQLPNKQNKPLMLRNLLNLALNKGWIKDKGFRHIEAPTDSNEWCKNMINTIPSLRNSQAHGTPLLVPDFYHHIRVCADLINQLFPMEPHA